MKDKGLDLFLMFMFGIGGIVILFLAWTRMISLPEKIFTSLIGAAGMVWVGFKITHLSIDKNREN